MRWYGAVLAGVALAGAAACSDARASVEPMPPEQRPTPEQRAGLATITGRWLFTGFEYPAQDTQRVREQVYQLTPPGEFQIATQRLDSIAGQYSRAGAVFPLSGELRRDGIFAFVVGAPGEAAFVAGRYDRDTLWIELTGFPSSASWPPGTRAALVHRPRGAPFTRLRGFVPPPDTTKVDSAGAPSEGNTPAPSDEQRPQPQPEPTREQPSRPAPSPPPVAEPTETVPTVPQQRPRPRPRDTVRVQPPEEPFPVTPPPPPTDEPPLPPVSRDTIRIGVPPPR